jgi:small subunit ribosomal protein S11
MVEKKETKIKKKEIEEEVIQEIPLEDEEEIVKISEERVISKKPIVSKESEAVINIYTSFNNTIVHVTDMAGKTISKVTGGMVTKHNRLKANPTIAMFIAKRLAEEVKDLGIKSFYIRIRAKTRNPAPGPGANTIVKSLTREGFKILNILDMTRLPRGGPKKKGGRRGRRP